MNERKDGGPAYPHIMAEGHKDYAGGMSLRDQFAMAALQGCLAYSHLNESWGDYHNNGTSDDLATHCYSVADAMLRARAVTSHNSGAAT